MKTKLSENYTIHNENQTTVVSWVEASATFFGHYQALCAYLNRAEGRETSHQGAIPSTGQCPRHHLADLLNGMGLVLGELLDDMQGEDILTYSSVKSNYVRLTKHIRILTSWNHKAQTILFLLAQPPY